LIVQYQNHNTMNIGSEITMVTTPCIFHQLRHCRSVVLT